MNYDELAFVNQQLAGMLKAGIPLEGSLKQLCATMQRGALRTELERLDEDLAQGKPLVEALAVRQLPEFYKIMLKVGIKGDDLPGVLVLLADYYSKVDSLWARLKGVMVYPVIVLLTMSLVSVFVAFVVGDFLLGKDGVFRDIIEDSLNGVPVPWMVSPEFIMADLTIPVVILIALSIGAICALSIPRLRHAMRWRLPGFREASLSQLAMTVSLLLRGGNTLHDALGMAGQMEKGNKVGRGLVYWQSELAAGGGRIEPRSASAYALPPLFFWAISGSGEDVARGFGQAAELYYRRAVYRIELMLYAALPISVVMLGALIFLQAFPAFRAMIYMMNSLGRVW